MIAHSLVLSAHRGFFCPISFHHALEIYFPYIQWLHHKGIVSIQAFTKICLMSVHMFMSDQTFINQLCERSYISLWAIKNTLMIVHSLVLSAHRGFFLSNFFHHALETYFPHILSDFMLKKTIIGYLNFFLMSAHKMWPLTTYNLDMFIPTSWGNIVPVCNALLT